MADQVIGITIKGIGDFSDVVSNVNNVQKALTKLKLPDKIGNNLTKNISAFHSEYEKYQKKISEGIKTQGDYNQVEKSLNRLKSLYQEIGQDVTKLSKLDMDSLLNLDLGEFKQLRNEISNVEKEINKVQSAKINTDTIKAPMDALRKSLKGKKFSEEGSGLLDQLIGNIKSGKVEEAKSVLNELDNAVKRITPPKNAEGNFIERVVGKLNPGNAKAATGAIEQLKQILSSTDEEVSPLIQVLDQLQKEFLETKNSASGEIFGGANKFEETKDEVEKVTDALKNMHEQEFNFGRQVQDIDRQIQSYFGLAQMIRKVGDIARSAFNTVKELDASMTETAVVTNFDVGDMWDMLPTYTEQANQLGSTIKDVYDAATLYYQQGLNTDQAMGLANETLKMARIAGMDAAEATDMMTSALRGFNMEINQASAQKVNDIYSQLAAVTASDTREIGTAMEKTASLASSANMKIETTSAFLAQMIETTREAPENLGTAMKTIIARFQEMKQDPTKLVDSEGQAMDVNKIDTALKSIGVALTNTKGEFRDLDDVFLDISAKWDSLTQGQQRYIATTAAGSRQQSRFIAMMSNYDRTMELVNEANNSAGASQKQFEKTMDSMSSKLNRLKNAWNQFTMGLMNNQILKTGVDGLTTFFSVVNKVIDALGNIPPDPFKGITKSILTLGATLSGLNFAKKFASGSVAAGVGWWKNEGKLRDNFMGGYGAPERLKPEDIYKNKLKQLEERKESKVVAKTDVRAEVRNVDTSSVDGAVDSKVKQEVENGPAVVAKKEVKPQAQVDTSNYGSGYIPFQRDENGLKVQKASDVTTLPQSTPVKEAGNKAKEATKDFTGLGNSIANAGYALQLFGDKLGPLGGVFSTVGTIMVSFGTTIGTVAATANAAMAEGATAAAAWGGAIGSAVLPILAVAAAAGALYFAYKAIDESYESAEERIEKFADAANTASDAYSSTKQESSELNDSLEQIQNNEDAFKGLVAGTAEFNSKLIEANQKISELLQKYPELNDPKFLSTDENGLMHINKAGIDFVKEQQAQMVGNASALNTLQNARLKAEEYRQKAEDNEKQIQKITDPTISDANAIMNNVKVDRTLTKEDKDKIADLKKEAKYNKENADSVEKMARQQAISNSLTNVEVGQRDKIASIYADTYDIALKRAEAEAKDVGPEAKKKAYADFYGYNYDAISKKMTNREGEEVKVDDSIINDAYSQITVLANVEASGESLDKMMDTIDAKFARGIGASSEGSRNLLTDILSRNAETDANAIKKILDDPGKMEEAIQKLSKEERAALLNMTQEEFDDDIKKYTDQLIKKANKAAKDIDKQQAQSREDLGRMLMQSQYGSVERAKHIAGESIAKQISDLKADQVNLLATVGKSLEENVGAEAMTNFVSSAADIYSKGGKQAQKQLTDILNATQWDSATSRLAAYTKMVNSNNQAISEMGKSMRGVSNESNLLGNVFDEFLGGDWQEISENIDDFKNATGEIDSSGIMKMSEQSGKLKTLLDSGEVSASGLAKALQSVNDGSIYQVNDTVLKLLSSLDRLTDKAHEAHNIIQNFDAGIDTGEGEDFVKENAKKAQEYYDHGEWGNEQLQNYIKLAAGEEQWNKALKKNDGDLRKTTGSLMKYVNTFKDGFGPAWDQIVDKQSIAGGSFKERIKDFKKLSAESKSLGEEFEKVKFFYNDDGYLSFDIGNLTTDELQTYFEEIYGVSKEYAALLMQDLKNYDGTVSSTLRKNDLAAMAGTDEFQRDHLNANGEVALATSDINAFVAAGGKLSELADALGITEKELLSNRFKTTKNKEEITDGSTLLKNYTDTFFKGGMKDMFNQASLQSSFGNFDIAKLIADTQSKGMSSEQALNTAYEAYKAAQAEGQATTYNGMKLEGEFKSAEEFKDALTSMTESSQWVQVGQTIGQQIVAAMNANEFLSNLRNGEQPGAITDTRDGFQLDKENLKTVVDQIKTSGETPEQAQKDIIQYLGQSKEMFQAISSEEKRGEILGNIAEQLKGLNFNPKQIEDIFQKSLGTGYDVFKAQQQISELGPNGKRAYDYYLKNGFGNTDINNRQALNWGEDPTKNKNFKNAKTWGWTAEDLKNQTSTFLSSAMGFGEKGKEVQIAFTPMLQGEDGKPQVLSSKSVTSYLDQIVKKSTDENGKINIDDLMKFDAEGITDKNGNKISNLIMGAFEGKNAVETSGALGDLEHLLEEAKTKGYDLQEVLNGISFSPKLEGAELENYIGKIEGLSDGQKKILLSTELSGDEKVTQFLQSIQKEFGDGDTKKKQVILEATQKFSEGDKEGGKKLLKDAGFSDEQIQKIEQKVSITYEGKIANESEFKSSLNRQIDALVEKTGKKKRKGQTTVEEKVTVKGGKTKQQSERKNTKSTHTIETKTKGEEKVKKLDKSVGKVHSKSISVVATTTGKAAVDTLKNALNNLHDKTVNVRVRKTGAQPHTGGMITPSGPIYRARGGIASNPMFKREGTDTIPAMLTPGEYVHNRDAVKYFGVDFMRRINHRDLNGALQSFGSAARGARGTIGPKNKGGLTLTGEEGFEIAWLPSENRSIILGDGGPQMITLPDDAVVYTHEQSKNILKRKSIDAGSSRGGYTGRKKTSSSGGGSGGSNKKSGNGGGGNKKRNNGGNGSDKKQNKERSKIIEKAGKVAVWWENQTRKIDAVQRTIDKNLKAFEKAIGIFGATFNSIKPTVNSYVAKLNQSIALNRQSLQRADSGLKTISGRTSKTTAQKNASTNLAKAQKALNKAQKTKSKKDDKKAKKQLKKAQEADKKANAGSYASISYEQTKVTKSKKGKKKKTKVTKKANVNLANYIRYDAATGAYVIDQGAIDKVAKKNKSKAKAIADEANKRIDDLQGKRDTAEDNIIKAQEAYETLSQKIYDTFVSWETELTKIWNITQKISEIEAKTSRLKEATSLQEAQLASGLSQATKEFNARSIDIFRTQLSGMGKTIEQQGNLIKEQRDKILESINGTADKETLANLNAKITNNDNIKTNNKNIDTKKSNKDSKWNTLKQANDRVKSLNTKKKKLEDKLKKKNLSAKDKKAAKKELKAVKQQLKQAKAQVTSAQNAYNSAKTAYDTAVRNNPKQTALDAETEIRYKQQQKYLQEQEDLRNRASKYMNFDVRDDGTISIDFNTDLFEQDKREIGITADDAKKIQDYIKDLTTQTEDLNKTYTDLTQSLTELYTTLADLQEEQADNSEKLLSIVEEEQQKDIDEIKNISESINESINDLFNEVKNRLSERRNQEDNAKTEQDITQKQQRLAALRADTSGGNAVEIAKLEKEIAEARQSYGRSLEDQLLDKLQKQADEASKQREIMIEIQQALLETTSKDSNLAQVNEWMSAIDLYSRGLLEDDKMESIWKEIQEKYLANEEYDSKTDARQVIIRKDFEELKNQLSTNASKQDATRNKITEVTTSIGETKSSLDLLNESINSLIKEYAKENEENKENDKNNEEEDKDTGGGSGNTSDEDISAKPVQNLPTFSTPQVAASMPRLRVNPKDEYNRKIAAAASNKKIGKKELQEVAKKAKNAGVGTKKYLQDLASTAGLTWTQVLTAAKAAGYDKDRLAATFDSDSFKKAFNNVYGSGAYKKARKKKATSYATGGLANYTGPAWLDGTPAKPELVLNAKDTENFLILRDILSDAIGTSSTNDNSSIVNEFNIHINVDQVANDYDVDKIITKVKKEITKSAGYRNVTQARSLR